MVRGEGIDERGDGGTREEEEDLNLDRFLTVATYKDDEILEDAELASITQQIKDSTAGLAQTILEINGRLDDLESFKVQATDGLNTIFAAANDLKTRMETAEKKIDRNRKWIKDIFDILGVEK